MKNHLFGFFWAFAALFSLLVSCDDNGGNDGPGSQPSSLVGRWEYNNTAFVFNSDKTGCHETAGTASGVRKSNFTWEQGSTHLLLSYDGSGGHVEGDYAYTYVLENNLLAIYYSDGELMGIYKKAVGNSDGNGNDNNGSNGSTLNGHEAVNLGLPSGIKWASCNVGASSPEDYGGYYAWGEVEEKEDYSWDTYKWYNGSDDTMTKYCTDSDYGTVDNKSVLDPEDDVAHVKWGGSWRMPTRAEQEELLDECTWEWTTLNGVNGYRVTGPNGNSIFLPAAGGRYGTDLYYRGGYGYCWSSSLYDGYSGGAYLLDFGSGYFDLNFDSRFYGLSVRPVSE